ncbi:hypothetical protein KAU43_07520 [candidate division WOR-3 bacterium]|nr:hypothetical protein [candidate division WOR-3 bacterium]
MNKTTKRILLITDDYSDEQFDDLKEECENGEHFSTLHCNEKNWLKFKFEKVDHFNKIGMEKYDAILIDYGLVGDEANLKILARLYDRGIPLAWIGGLVDFVKEDAKEKFPDFPFAHGIYSAGLEDYELLWVLYKLFEDEKGDAN